MEIDFRDGREFRRPQDVGGAAFEIPPYRARFQHGAAQESEAFQLYRQRDQIYGGVVRVFVADGQRLVLVRERGGTLSGAEKKRPVFPEYDFQRVITAAGFYLSDVRALTVHM